MMGAAWRLRVTAAVIGTVVGAVLAEVLVRFALGVPSFSDLEQRYEVDGVPSVTLGYFVPHPQLPFALRAGYGHWVMDRAWHPRPWRVDLDESGFRTMPASTGRVDRVMVGDSVTFGFGVDNNQTFPWLIAERQRQTIYNLSIPNAGPETYMRAAHGFLESHPQAAVTFVWFDGNDWDNVANGCWPGLAACRPPIDPQAQVRRLDVALPRDPPVWITAGVLRRSSVMYLVYQVMTGQGAGIGVRRAPRVFPDAEPLRLSARDTLQELQAAACLSPQEQAAAAGVTALLDRQDVEAAFAAAQALARALIDKDCYPIGRDARSLVGRMTNTVYKWRAARLFGTPPAAAHMPVEPCAESCASGTRSVFMSYLRDFASAGRDVSVVIVPAEAQIQSYDGSVHALCAELAASRVACLDLRGRISDHYRRGGSSLYLDGSHLTVAGHHNVADWLSALLTRPLTATLRAPHR
jgi:hypothetical protein